MSFRTDAPGRAHAARRLVQAAFAPLAIVAGLAACASSPTTATAQQGCTRYASASGSDSASGSSSAPFRTAQRLQDSLRPGEVGCLAPGQTFSGRLRGNNSGTPTAPIVMTSGPGPGRATILGEIYIPADTSDITYQNLVLNGRTSYRVSPSVNGDRIKFLSNEVTDDHHGICFHLGKIGEGVAEDIVIDGNRIHDCGRLPRTGLDHGVYAETTRNLRVTNNYIYDNADYGVHLYPDAQGSFIANNVIDGNGRGITVSGEDGYASSNNVIINNTISNSLETTNIESYWGGGTGTGNRVETNCVWNGARGNIGSTAGLNIVGTVTGDPRYVSRADKNFALQPGSPCAGKAPAAALAALPAGSPPPSAPAAPGPPAVSAAPAVPVAVVNPGPRTTKKPRVAPPPVRLRWLSGRPAFVVTTQPFRGRGTLVARADGTLLGHCVRVFRRSRRAACYFEFEPRRRAHRERIKVSANLPGKGRQRVRAKLVRRAPALRVAEPIGKGPDGVPTT